MLGLFKSKKKTARARVLVVDDETDIVDTIQHRLKFCEFGVITAYSGKEGLEKAANERPDLILLDIDMPVMNGFDMLKRLRSQPDIKDIPVIMLTVYSDKRDIAKAAEFSVADYITKPFDFTELVEKISNTLENKTNDNI